MTDDLPATRREMDMLRDELHRLDDHGSRGVGVMQTQMTDLVKDVTELKSEVNQRFEAHRIEHEKAARERVVGRRWLVGTGIAGLTAMTAMLALLFEILAKVH